MREREELCGGVHAGYCPWAMSAFTTWSECGGYVRVGAGERARELDEGELDALELGERLWTGT